MAKQEVYLDRVHALFMKYGVRGLTMEQLAKSIGVTKRTLYNNFGTREELLRVLIDYKSAGYREALLGLSSQPGKNAILVLLSVLDYLAASNSETTIVFLRSLYENHQDLYQYMKRKGERLVKEFFAMNIPRGRSEGLYRGDFDIDVIAILSYGSIDSFAENWPAQQDAVEVASVRRQVLTFLIRGMATSQGIELLEHELKKQRNF